MRAVGNHRLLAAHTHRSPTIEKIRQTGKKAMDSEGAFAISVRLCYTETVGNIGERSEASSDAERSVRTRSHVSMLAPHGVLTPDSSNMLFTRNTIGSDIVG